MHIMNTFPFVWVRHIMYYHGKHGGRLVALWIQRNVIQGRIVRVRACKQSGWLHTHVHHCIYFTILNDHHCVQREVLQCEKMALSNPACKEIITHSHTHRWKKPHLSPSRTLFLKKKPIVIQLVEVQLRAFQLQIRAELRIRIDNQGRSLPKTQASR